jgi:hypothetical protein
MQKETVTANFKYLAGVTKEDSNNLSQDSWPLGQELNPVSPE